MKRVLKALMIATAIALLAVPAFADGLCFDRHYDAVHLGKHPDQLVTSMTLALDPDGPVVRGSSTMDEGRIKIPFDFKIAMTKRGDSNRLGFRFPRSIPPM